MYHPDPYQELGRQRQATLLAEARRDHLAAQARLAEEPSTGPSALTRLASVLNRRRAARIHSILHPTA